MFCTSKIIALSVCILPLASLVYCLHLLADHCRRLLLIAIDLKGVLFFSLYLFEQKGHIDEVINFYRLSLLLLFSLNDCIPNPLGKQQSFFVSEKSLSLRSFEWLMSSINQHFNVLGPQFFVFIHDVF